MPPRIHAIPVLLALCSCLQQNPNFDIDPTTTGLTTGTGTVPTTGPEHTTSLVTTTGDDPSTSTGTTEAIESTGTTEPLTGDDPSSGGSTTLSFPLCPYEPPGVQIGLTEVLGGETEDITTRACGASETFGPVFTAGLENAAYTLQRCADAGCTECDPADKLVLDIVAPDPFTVAGLLPDSCAQLHVTWSRPSADDPELCVPSTVALVQLVAGKPAMVPSLLYRHTHMLPASDTVQGFTLAAGAAAVGAIDCECEGDCCREQPGSRVLSFTGAAGGEAFEVPMLESQQAVQGLALGTIEGDPQTGDLGLVRASFPQTCAALPDYEWLFQRSP